MVIKMCVIVDRKEINKSENFTCFELMVMQLCKYWSIDFWDMFAWRLSFSYCEVRSEKKRIFLFVLIEIIIKNLSLSNAI